MTMIQLKRYYPHIKEALTMEVSEEIAAVLSTGGRMGDSYKRRKREHGECSLETDPGFEGDVVSPPQTPEQTLENREGTAALYTALAQLSPTQGRRVYAHYILGISKAELARSEGVGKGRVSKSIDQGLLRLKKILEKSL